MSARVYARVFVALLAGVVLLTATTQAQTTWYVDDDAPNDPGPGDSLVSDPDENGSPEHPFDAIQEGINAAVDGDTVLVADGTYTGDDNRDLDFGGRLITLRSESGPVTCIIDCGGSASDHHRAFGFFGGETAEAVVEGFTITNGVVESRGGAIRCGGGTGPTILNCVITGNVADHRGGGIYCDDASNPVLINCTIHGNSVEYRGAGVSCDNGSSPTMLNCVITGNVADYRGGGIYCDHASNPVLINCTIHGNSVEYRGAGVSCDHGSSPTMLNCVITGNVADYRGGGIYCDGASNPKLVNSVVSGNTAATSGSGISCDHASNATIINSTVSANTGGGDGIFLNHDSSPTITNSIIWGNTSLEIRVLSGDPVITFSDIGGGWPGEGNIDADPLFVDPNGPDGDPNTWEDNDYRLGPGSPCIDAADNEAVPADQFDLDGDSDTTEPLPYDLDGNPRFVDDPDTDDTGNGTPPIVDMGAYEFQVGIVAYLDIKPGSCPNPLNRKSHGKLPVAIAGTAEFDVTQIDVDTLVLARADGVGGSVTPLIGPPGPGIHVEDVATPFEGEPCDCHDMNGDGFVDLVMKFQTQLVVAELQLDDLPGGTFVELVLSGELSDGTPFSATDCIRLVPPGSGSANVAAGPEGGDGGLDARPGSQPPNSEEGHPTGGASGQDADRAPGDADANEESQDTFAVPLAVCGALSPALSLATIIGVCVLRPRRP